MSSLRTLMTAPGEWRRRDTVDLYILVMIISGICGFIYEEIFYLIDLGELVKRGSSYGPWIPIYMFGGLLIVVTTLRLRKWPWAVFLAGVVGSGVLEYATGWVLYEFFHVRLWDYNTEIWNWGNVNGYICARSVLLFGAAGVMLVYGIVPFLIRFLETHRSRKVDLLCTGLIVLWLADILVYRLLH